MLGKLSARERPTNLDNSGQEPIAVNAGRACLDIFSCLYFLFLLPLWQTVNRD